MARVLLLLMAVAATGCYSPSPLYNPGTADRQQARAIWFDPYPDPEAGPEVVGGRPLGYQNPVPEPVSAQQYSPAQTPPAYQGRAPLQLAPGSVTPQFMPDPNLPLTAPPAYPAVPAEIPLGAAPPLGYQPPVVQPALGSNSAPANHWRY